jgi:hypothetical protein
MCRDVKNRDDWRFRTRVANPKQLGDRQRRRISLTFGLSFGILISQQVYFDNGEWISDTDFLINTF